MNNILTANEYNHEFSDDGPVRSYDCNQLASNNPLEDTRSEANCVMTPGKISTNFQQILGCKMFYFRDAFGSI